VQKTNCFTMNELLIYREPGPITEDLEHTRPG